MGFGLMFIGYFFAYLISLVIVPKILGYLIMVWATVKLSAFDLKFKRCLPALGGLVIVSGYGLLKDIFKYLSIESSLFGGVIPNVISLVEEALVLIFHALLMLAIANIAKDIGLEKIRFRAMRNLLIIAVAEAAYTVMTFLPKNETTQSIFLGAVILRFIWIALDLILLVSCYRMICEEGDEDMPDKEINIPIIKQMESTMRKRDKNAFDSGISLANKRMDKIERKRRKKEGKK